MNVLSVEDVQNRSPALFVDYKKDLGATSLISIQGSGPKYGLVMVGGISWNLMSDGVAEEGSLVDLTSKPSSLPFRA